MNFRKKNMSKKRERGVGSKSDGELSVDEFSAHVTGSACPSKNANQRNGFHCKVPHTIGDQNHQLVKSYYDQGLR